jgi:ketosteroid isomerase-like protein
MEARADISALVTRYAIACDEHDLPELESLFTEDATFDSPSGIMRASGRSEIIAMFADVLSIRGPGYHWTHDHLIRFDQGAESSASGLLLSHAETSPRGIQSIAAMKYDDLYRLEDDAWRFARRTISFLYYVPIDEYKDVLLRRDRVAVGDDRREADYPEQLPAWSSFAEKYVKD